MTTVGEILRESRSKRRLTLEQVETATRIRAKFLAAMENNEFEKIPPGTFARGLIKNYAVFLGLPAEEILAFYRRQVAEKKVENLPRANPIPNRFAITPQLLTTILAAVLVILFFGYLIFSYVTFAGSPALLVTAPKNNIVVTSEKIDVIGKTDPDAQLSVNNQTVNLSENGSFDVNIVLSPGINTITVTAMNKFKRQTTVVRTLRLQK